MINKFLQAKHWQLFSLLCVVPFVFQIVAMASIFLGLNVDENMQPPFFLGVFAIFPLIILLNTGIFFGWFWSIAIGLQSYIPVEERPNLKKFKIFFFVPAVYFLIIMVFFGTTVFGISSGESEMGGIIGKMIAIILPLHLFTMFCMFYQLYFVSKTIKTAELQRSVTFSDYLGEFLMLWFFPIGIWVIQPKINRIVNKNLSADSQISSNQ